jgi:mycofactocin precursor
MSAMDNPETADATSVAVAPGPDDDVEFVEDDLLVEEISIDGMCGVY